LKSVKAEELPGKGILEQEASERLSLTRWRGDQTQRIGQRWREDHGAWQKAWEHQRDEHCVPDVAPRRDADARAARVKADYAPGLESRVRGNVQARVRRGAVGNMPQGNALAAYSTH